MNDALKNPIVLFIAALLGIWLIFKILKIVLGLFWVFVLAFVVLFFVNTRFRNIVRSIFNRFFSKS